MQNSFYKKWFFKDIVLIFISILFLYYTYKNFSINDLIIALNIVNLAVVLIYLILFLPLIYIASKKYVVLVDKYKKIKLSTSVKVNLISSFYNLFFPAKLGDLTRYYYSKIPKKYFVNCLSLFFFEKLISFLSLILIVLFCSEIKSQQNLIILSILLILGIIVFSNKFDKVNNLINLIFQKIHQLKFRIHSKVKEKLDSKFFFFFYTRYNSLVNNFFTNLRHIVSIRHENQFFTYMFYIWLFNFSWFNTYKFWWFWDKRYYHF